MKHYISSIFIAFYLTIGGLAWGNNQTSADGPKRDAERPEMDFRKAAAEGKIEMLTQHLKAGTKIDEQGGEHNSTALHAAAYYGRLEAVKFLIDKNADINARNKHGQTPLDVAWHDQENRDKFDEETREAKLATGVFIKNKGGLNGEGKDKSPWIWLAFLPCIIPILFFLGVLYALVTKEPPEDIPTPSKEITVTTSPQITGKRVVRTLGLVRGNTIRARHIGKDIMAGLRSLVGGEVDEYGKLLAESREQALDRMLLQAEDLGANAVIGLQFQTSVVMEGAAEMMAFGTAVVVSDEKS